MDAVQVDVFVLNFNGRDLLAECLPSIVRAAAASRHHCRVVVIDNDSTDDSVAFVEQNFPTVAVRRLPNLGLCSFNRAVAESACSVALLLNNDVKAADDAFDPLIEPLLRKSEDAEPIAIAAPRCFLFDGLTHEGFKTAVSWRYGLVQATAHFPGAEGVADLAGPTASVGAAMAVDRDAFVSLGGFDTAYLPGRIEDLDFAYRAFQAGRQAIYVPTSIFFHRGAATFGRAYGSGGCDRLALRNTLVFQWRHLRRPQHLLQQLVWLPIRLVRDIVTAPFVDRDDRFAFCRALVAAWEIHRAGGRESADFGSTDREQEFFLRHSPERLSESNAASRETSDSVLAEEAARDANYPISRWCLRPAARWVAARLARRAVHPNYITALGLLCALSAAAALVAWPHAPWIAAILILASWFCDRVDGPLSRLQNTSGPLGAWIDANVDEFVDLGLHVATAGVAAQLSGSPLPWFLLIGFLVGKYLLMHGLASDDDLTAATAPKCTPSGATDDRPSVWRTLYHLPANADVRAHLLIFAVAGGWLTFELAIVAVYYNLRWPLRYVLLARRFRAMAPGAAP